MAKIKSVKLALEDEDLTHFRYNANIVAYIKLKFNEKEVQDLLKLELHFFLYGNKNNYEIPAVIDFSTLDNPRTLNLLAHKRIIVSAENLKSSVTENIEVELEENQIYNGLRIFALLLPIGNSVSKWSPEYYFDILLR